MRTKILLIAMLSAFTSSGQFTNPLDQQMLSLTQNLDFQEVASGILFDRGTQLAKPSGFQGGLMADTVFSFDDWYLQYGAMYTGNVLTVNSLSAVSEWKPSVISLLDSNIVPLMVMHIDYHRLINDSTLFYNSFNLINDHLYDISGRVDSPYDAHE